MALGEELRSLRVGEVLLGGLEGLAESDGRAGLARRSEGLAWAGLLGGSERGA